MHPFDPARNATRTALIILFFCFATNTILRGTQDSYAIFLIPIAADFGLLRGEVSSVYSLTYAVVGLSGPIVGSLFDRWGPKRLYLIGITAGITGCLAASKIGSLWQFYLVLGLLFGFGAACVGFVPMAALLSRWFSARLNTALAIGHASHGIGMLLLAPTAQYLITIFGWRDAYIILGGLGLVLLPLFFIVPWSSAKLGHPKIRSQNPQLWTENHKGMKTNDITLFQAVKRKAFWGLIMSFFFTTLGMFTVVLQTPAYLIWVGYSPQEAANAFGLLGLLLPVGMVTFGWLGDRIGLRRTVLISYTGTFLGILAVSTLRSGPSAIALTLFIFLFGSTLGSRGPAMSTIAAFIFGGAHFGRIFGFITVGMGIGGATGAWLGGFLVDVTGNYLTGQIIAMGAILCSSLPFMLIREMAKR